MGLLVVSALAPKLHHGWAGHFMHFEDNHVCKKALLVRDFEWWERVRSDPARPIRAHAGRPCTWEQKPCSCSMGSVEAIILRQNGLEVL
jgi:hypothetical protein